MVGRKEGRKEMGRQRNVLRKFVNLEKSVLSFTRHCEIHNSYATTHLKSGGWMGKLFHHNFVKLEEEMKT